MSLRKRILTSLLLLGLAAAAEAAALLDTTSTVAPDSAALVLADSMALDSLTADSIALDSIAPDTVPAKRKRRLELPKMLDSADVVVDTSHASRILPYRVNHYNNEVLRVPLDTSLYYYRTDYPFMRSDVGAIFLGTLGSPAMYMDFFKRDESEDFLFQKPYQSYFFTPESITFYNSTTPYTVLYYDWTLNSKSEMEDHLRVLHNQNIRHDLTYQIAYNGPRSKGSYPRQRVETRTAHVGLSYLGSLYKANLGYMFSKAEMQENGGIANDRMLTDTLLNNPQDFDVRLPDAAAVNFVQSSTFYLTHSVDIPMIYLGNDSVINNILIGRIGHALEYATYGKRYSDNGNDTTYYLNNFFNRGATRDSAGLRKWENRLFIQLRPLRAYIFEALTGGIGYKSMQRYAFNPEMYLNGTSSTGLSTAYFYASISAWYKQYFKWNAEFRQNFAGTYQAGDMEVRGSMSLSAYPLKGGLHLKVDGLFARRQPDVFLQSYSSNHFRWSNKFGTTTEFRVDGTLSVPDFHLDLGFSFANYTEGYIYFGTDAMPHQYGSPLSVMGATLSHRLAVGHFNLNHRLLGQLSENSHIVSLPALAVEADYYYERQLVRNVLRVQAGLNIRYNTPFNGYGYNPAVGMFHTSDVSMGGYPWVDAFIAFRWKRATPFVKVENLTQSLMKDAHAPYFNNGYFSAVHYPRNEMVFKVGLSWKWFD